MPVQCKSVLVVDDEKVILDNLARELASDDLRITLVSSGAEALARLDDGCFDLVITDLLMPGVDGFEVLKAAKQQDRQIMVIILTGFGDMDTAIDALRLGADDFLQKPCDTEELMYRMSNCFQKQDLSRKVEMYEHFLPMCCYCKKIRDDSEAGRGKGKWYSLEEYLSRSKGISVSHGCCPECLRKNLSS